jgi:hypothetical protein
VAPLALMTLEEGLEYWVTIAEAHRVTGQTQTAELIDKMCKWFASSTEPYRRWLTESEASLQSGRSDRWLHSQFPLWEASGHAKWEGKQRFYRMVVVPTRGPAQGSFEAGRLAEERAA